MRLKRETQGAFCVLNAKSQTQKSMKINVICTVAHSQAMYPCHSLVHTARHTSQGYGVGRSCLPVMYKP